jgi:predicted transcriptional regulator
MAREPGPRRVKRSVNLDPDLAAWLTEYAREMSASENTIVRQALRAMKDAVARARTEHTPESLAAMEIEGPSDGGAI